MEFWVLNPYRLTGGATFFVSYRAATYRGCKRKNVWITHHRKILLIKWNSRKKGTKYIVSIKFLYFLNDRGVIYQLDRITQMDDNINDQNIRYIWENYYFWHSPGIEILTTCWINLIKFIYHHNHIKFFIYFKIYF